MPTFLFLKSVFPVDNLVRFRATATAFLSEFVEFAGGVCFLALTLVSGPFVVIIRGLGAADVAIGGDGACGQWWRGLQRLLQGSAVAAGCTCGVLHVVSGGGWQCRVRVVGEDWLRFWASLNKRVLRAEEFIFSLEGDDIVIVSSIHSRALRLRLTEFQLRGL